MTTVLTPSPLFEAVEPVTRLSPGSNGMLMTSEEFGDVTEAERGYRYELIRGIVIVSPPPSPASRGPNEELGRLLLNYRDDHPLGKAMDDTLPENYVRVEDDWRIADRAIWCGLGRRPNADNDVPTIAVEFVSVGSRSRRRDYIEKRNQYIARGVREYWIIDRFRRSLAVVFADGKDQVFGEKAIYETPLLPGFELPMEKLLSLADRWAK